LRLTIGLNDVAVFEKRQARNRCWIKLQKMMLWTTARLYSSAGT